MPYRSHPIVRRKNHIHDLLTAVAYAAQEKERLWRFLEDILTPNELGEVLLRFQIVKRLHQGVSQRTIAKELGVSIATITRGSRMLRNKKGGFNEVLVTLNTKAEK